MERADLNRWFIIILFLIIAYLSFLLLQGFIISVFIGAIIAYMVYPLHKRLVKITKSKRSSAIILSVIAIMIITLIFSLIIPQIIIEGGRFYQSSDEILLKQFEEIKRCSLDSEDLKCKIIVYILRNVDEKTIEDTGITIIQLTSNFIVNNVIVFFTNLSNLVLQLTIILFSTSYFLHKGSDIVQRTLDILPIKKSHESKIVNRIDEVMRAVIFGNIVIAFVEGIIAAILFLFLGIGMPCVWGLLVMFFALIPPLGAAIIWAPAAIILFILGEYTKAIILAVSCLVIMGYLDNILRPMIISKKVRLSSIWILLGVFGGLSTFGFIGIFIGPLILALFVTFLALVDEELIEKEK